jgi:hypothetical protein
MISVLGRIGLGTWELGVPNTGNPPPGTFTAIWGPDAKLTGAGGTPQGFAAVLGAIRLGKFQLGQVPAVTLNPLVLQAFIAEMFPDALFKQPVVSGTFEADWFPDAFILGNLGTLAFIARMFPDALISGDQHYSTGEFTWEPQPDAFIEGTRPPGFSALWFPDAAVFPLGSQSVDCTAGANPPDPLINNSVY